MTRLMIMLADIDMKPTQTRMEDLLSLGQANPFNVSLHRLTAIVHKNIADMQVQQNNSNRQPQKNDHNIETKRDDTKTNRVGLHVGCG